MVRDFSVRRACHAAGVARSPFRTTQEGIQPAVSVWTDLRVLDAGVAAGCRFFASCRRVGGSGFDWSGFAPAPGGLDRDLLPRGWRGDLRSGAECPAPPLQREVPM